MNTTDTKERGSSSMGDMENMPKSQAEHHWLHQFVGEWEAEAECFMDPDGPPEISKGTEHIRSLGEFWVLVELEAEMAGSSFRAIQTLGFDPEKNKYIGTWVDSITSYMWRYEGTVNEAGTTLTLDTEGPCMTSPGKISKFREVLEIVDPNQKTYTSSILDEDGHWNTCLRARSVRVNQNL